MAETQGVWGIDIGQAGLKAVRLRYAEAAHQALAVAFDYVPHPKILSQPDAIPEELIQQALETFLSRNDVRGDKVAISVPGQSTLVRFIQLPPVESSKVADIVRYEAKQQIPFDLDDVIWDFQPLGGAVEESGFLLEAEVGLFAMKRTDVDRQLKPFLDAKVEVDLIQAAPLGLVNVLCYDQIGIRAGESFVPPEEYTILLDMGADNTTLIVSNGEKIWIRNVPIGGNHFTRALTKEMKLTFAKAEHLKCNATRSPDPRAVFQALRPVFNNFVSEIQRSIGFFSSVNRDARIGKILGLGNGFKLAGLQKFLQQNLNYEVQRLDQFEGVVGDAVLSAPLFEENILSFAVPYGLALQGLGLTNIRTTLLPPEITMERTIRRKKPWAVVSAASLLTGLAISAFGYANAENSVSEERFGEVESQAQTHAGEITGYTDAYATEKSENDGVYETADQLIANLRTRDMWLEVLTSINACLPRDNANDREVNTEIETRNAINILSVTAEPVDDLAAWFNAIPTTQKGFMVETNSDKTTPPEGPGWVFTLVGNHYHNAKDAKRQDKGVYYVGHTLQVDLAKWNLKPVGSNRLIPVRKLGISHAVVTNQSQEEVSFDPKTGQQIGGSGGRFGGSPYGSDSSFSGSGGSFSSGTAGSFSRPSGTTPRLPGVRTPGSDDSEDFVPPKVVTRQNFTLEFAWRRTPKDDRTDAPPETDAPEESTETPDE